MSDLKIENYLNEGFNMKTIIRVDEEYKIIERRVFDEKPIPNKIIDLIIPILKKGGVKVGQGSQRNERPTQTGRTKLQLCR